MSTTILIPARSGSTRVLNKNLLDIGDIPLIQHSITSSLSSKANRVVVSTNCSRIASLAVELGAEVPVPLHPRGGELDIPAHGRHGREGEAQRVRPELRIHDDVMAVITALLGPLMQLPP